MASRSQDLDRELARFADQQRAWGLYQLNLLYDRLDERNLDRSYALILPFLLGLYGAMVIRALDTADEYWHLKARLGGYYMQFDWRNSRLPLTTQLPSGMPLHTYLRRAPLGMKRLIADGMDTRDAINVSRARSAQVYRSVTHKLLRDTNGYRNDLLKITYNAVRKPNLPPLTTDTVKPLLPPQFAPWLDELQDLVDEQTLGRSQTRRPRVSDQPAPTRPTPSPPAARPTSPTSPTRPTPPARPTSPTSPTPPARPTSPTPPARPTSPTPPARPTSPTPSVPAPLEPVRPTLPQQFAPWLDDLETLANQRLAPEAVPELFLDDVRNYQETPNSRWRRVPNAGACGYCLTLASRGSIYYSKTTARRADHANCRCEVVVNMGLPNLIISEEDYRRYTERDADGKLRSWRISTVPGARRGNPRRYTYEYTLEDFDFVVYRGAKPPIARWGS